MGKSKTCSLCYQVKKDHPIEHIDGSSIGLYTRVSGKPGEEYETTDEYQDKNSCGSISLGCTYGSTLYDLDNYYETDVELSKLVKGVERIDKQSRYSMMLSTVALVLVIYGVHHIISRD